MIARDVHSFVSIYINRGWSPVRIPPKEKCPRDIKWEQRKYGPSDFGPHDNIGINLGEPSNWLTDIDLDCTEARELAPKILPLTASFGRDSNPNSHYLFYCKGIETQKFNDPISLKCMFEIRATPHSNIGKGYGGTQTVFPGSVHPTGERIKWSNPIKILNISKEELTELCNSLALMILGTKYKTIDSNLWSNPTEIQIKRYPGQPFPINKAIDFVHKTIANWKGQKQVSIPITNNTYKSIVESFNASNTFESGKCPVNGCNGINSFKTFKGKYSCFHDSHPNTCGTRGSSGVIMDSLDIVSHNHSMTPKEYLVSINQYKPSIREEPPPIGELSKLVTVEEQRRALAELPDLEIENFIPDTDPERPVFQITAGNGFKSVDFGIKAVIRDPALYQRGGKLVTIDTGIISTISAPFLWERLSRHVAWHRYDETRQDWTPCNPPKEVVSSVHGRAAWPELRDLAGVVNSPVIRSDGSLLYSPGYDSTTKLFYHPVGRCDPVPEHPSKNDALACINELLDVVIDFPFLKDSHRSAWLAALLTPLARTALDACNVPLFLVDGNSRGCGKSKLIDLISLVVCGRTAARASYTSDQDELEKRVISNMLTGDQMVLFDNLAGEFGGSCIDKLLTSEGWFQGRLLGTNTAPLMRNTTTWYATGNNANLSGDIVRRIIHIRLETPLEHPDERSDFKRSRLLNWVRAERPHLLCAALTLIRAWYEAGAPQQTDLPTFGSFESWSDMIRNILVWAEQPDPWGETRAALRRSDTGDMLHLAILNGLVRMGACESILSLSDIDRKLPDNQALRDALAVAGIYRDGHLDMKKLSKRLNGYRGYNKNDMHIQSDELGWRVVRR
jgi:hypothetical protein